VAKPKTIVFSTFGVREGLLHECAADRTRKDGLICAAQELNKLLSRSARHAEELTGVDRRLFRVVKLRETEEDKRLRHVACLLSDIGWRVHPDHRGEETLSLIINAISARSPSGAPRALSVFYRYAAERGKRAAGADPSIGVRRRLVERARLLGAAFRVAHLISGGAPGVLPHPFPQPGPQLMLVFEHRMVDLVADRRRSRFKQLARLVGRSGSSSGGNACIRKSGEALFRADHARKNQL